MNRTQVIDYRRGRFHLLGDSQRGLDLREYAFGLVLGRERTGRH